MTAALAIGLLFALTGCAPQILAPRILLESPKAADPESSVTTVDPGILRDENRLAQDAQNVVLPDRALRLRVTKPIQLAGFETVTLRVSGDYAGMRVYLYAARDLAPLELAAENAIKGSVPPGTARITFPLHGALPQLARVEIAIPAGTLKVHELRFGREPALTARIGGAEWRIDSRLPVALDVSASNARWSFALAPDPATRAVVLRMDYTPQEGQDTPAARTVSVLLTAPGELNLRRSMVLRPGDRDYALVLPPAGVVPTRIEVESAVLGSWLGGITEIVPNSRVAVAPIPVDVGQLLTIPRSWWRHADYELYRWSLYPRILLLDTRTYAVQSAFFGRLAFFVEKNGFRGRLLTDQELAGRHDWNAHNYNGEGLAAFFNAAEHAELPLNSYELELREMVAEHGIIVRSGERWVAGPGGILGISQASHRELRALLLIHEVTHGLFYEEPAYQAAVFTYWDQTLSEAERDYWRVLLRSMNYDPADRYLMANEFQAYLMQQRLSTVRWYMGTRLADRLRATLPGQTGWINRFLANHPNTFYDAALALNRVLWEEAGFLGADFWTIIDPLDP